MNGSNVGGIGGALKGLLLASQGVRPMVTSPTFAADVAAAAAGRGVVVACEAGGTLDASSGFLFGKTSRSLNAIFRILVEGDGGVAPSRIRHLGGGVYGWWRDERPMEGEGEYDPRNVGKTPAATAGAPPAEGGSMKW